MCWGSISPLFSSRSGLLVEKFKINFPDLSKVAIFVLCIPSLAGSGFKERSAQVQYLLPTSLLWKGITTRVWRWFFFSHASNRQIKVSRKIKIWHELLGCKTKRQLTSLSAHFLDVPLWRQEQPPLIILLSRALQKKLTVIAQKNFLSPKYYVHEAIAVSLLAWLEYLGYLNISVVLHTGNDSLLLHTIILFPPRRFLTPKAGTTQQKGTEVPHWVLHRPKDINKLQKSLEE